MLVFPSFWLQELVYFSIFWVGAFGCFQNRPAVHGNHRKENNINYRAKVYELPISYSGRDYTEDKRIGWKDGIVALYCIIKYNVFGGKVQSGRQ